jgi:hypothetical protein
MAGSAFAAPLVIQNGYLRVGVSDDYGTLGSNGTTPPGILYDPTGASAYGNNDFLTPGTPFEAFVIQYERGGVTFSSGGDNAGTHADFNITLTQVSPTAASASGPLAAGADAGNVSIKNDYSLSGAASGQFINVTTTITNHGTAPMTDVRFLRSLDPDPDLNNYGTYNTLNQVVSTSKVCASGANTGQTICLLSDDSRYATKIAGIIANCCAYITPDAFLSTYSTATSSADYSIRLYISIGDIAPGESVTVTYTYLLTEDVNTATTPMAVVSSNVFSPAPTPAGGTLPTVTIACGAATDTGTTPSVEAPDGTSCFVSISSAAVAPAGYSVTGTVFGGAGVDPATGAFTMPAGGISNITVTTLLRDLRILPPGGSAAVPVGDGPWRYLLALCVMALALGTLGWRRRG